MPESPTREVIELNLHDKFRAERLPFRRALGAPTAWSSGRFTGKAGWFDQTFQLFRQRGPFVVVDGRSEADVVQLSFIVIKA